MTEEERWSNAEDMQAVLDLEPLDRDLFRARNAISARLRQSLYGGQVAAQALRAAGLTVDPDRHAPGPTSPRTAPSSSRTGC